MKKLFYLAIALTFLMGLVPKKPFMKVGLVADPQYANQPPSGKRHFKENLWKLEEAIDTFNY